ncbi:MAG: DUF779 domain-containing protein [Actinobacteria bacterium]|uniref:Unannotated protein n=1 Tax=freshwater metagenome TaxID=449393 RepID=A0A6J7B517_9ZZZZ|nr:DUF779 domain-containing protein [Actinomycetota bacterium]
MSLPSRVDYTPEAAELLLKLTKINGPLMFHQSGGCCDGSSPMCYLKGEFRVGGSDVLVGEFIIQGINEAIQVWMSASQFEYWKHTHLTIDVVVGRGGGFSLESTEGKRFLTRSRLFTDDEWRVLENSPVTTGA